MGPILYASALLLLLAGGVGAENKPWRAAAQEPFCYVLQGLSTVICVANESQIPHGTGWRYCGSSMQECEAVQDHTPLLPGRWLWETDFGSRTERAVPAQPPNGEWKAEEPLRAIDTETGTIYVRQAGAWVEERRQRPGCPEWLEFPGVAHKVKLSAIVRIAQVKYSVYFSTGGETVEVRHSTVQGAENTYAKHGAWVACREGQ